MKIEKPTKAIATTAKINFFKEHEKLFLGWQLVKEFVPVLLVTLGISVWIRCCMAMEEPIYLQKALICSFIIMAVLCMKKSSQLR